MFSFAYVGAVFISLGISGGVSMSHKSPLMWSQRPSSDKWIGYVMAHYKRWYETNKVSHPIASVASIDQMISMDSGSGFDF